MMTTNIHGDQPDRTRSDPGKTSLIVTLGQEHGFHNLLRVIVNEFGYQCHADEIHEGIVQQVARLQPRAIVLDVDYGHERLSWAVIRALKEFPATADIPVVACAAAGWLLDEQRPFLDHNDVRTWSEPFDMGELLRTLDSALADPRPESRAPSRQRGYGSSMKVAV